MGMSKLKPILQQIYDAGLENARFEVEVNDETIFTSDDVFYELAYNYTEFFVNTGIFQATAAGFIGLWDHYRSTTKDQLYRFWKGLKAEYDPISNYDMLEVGADGKRISKETDTVTPYGGTQTATQVNRFGLNSGETGKPYDTSTMTVKPIPDVETKTETTREVESDVSIDFDGDTLTGYHEGTEHYFKRKGNIGVQTAADMLLKEQELRERGMNLLRDYVKGFIDRYCFIDPEVTP